jgi:hypothetical protein
MTTRIHWTVSSEGESKAWATTVSSEGESKAWATHQAPVVPSLGFRTGAAADLCASLARLLSPVLDVLIRLWLAEGFLMTDVLQHMLPGGQLIMQDHISPSASSFAGLAATSFGIFVQTICPVVAGRRTVHAPCCSSAADAGACLADSWARAARALLSVIPRVDRRARTGTALS